MKLRVASMYNGRSSALSSPKITLPGTCTLSCHEPKTLSKSQPSSFHSELLSYKKDIYRMYTACVSRKYGYSLCVEPYSGEKLIMTGSEVLESVSARLK